MSRPRIAIANGMIRLGGFLQSMAISVMRPDDLTEFSRRSYAENSQVDDWGRREFIDLELDAAEESFLSHLPCQSGKLLLLGVGGGREARVLARHGYDVTGVDFIPAMVERARENTREQGLDMAGLVQELSRLDLPACTFSVAWFSPRMYSFVPTHGRRVALLRRIAVALRPGGCVFCQFHWDRSNQASPRRRRLQRFLAWVTFGYREYEPGDQLWRQREFLHAFHDEEDLRGEFTAAGFAVAHLEVSDDNSSGGAILLKPDIPS